MPWIRALPDRVALGSLSTELGDVKICLKACTFGVSHMITKSEFREIAHFNQQGAAKKTLPRIFVVIHVIFIKENGPVVSWDDDLPRFQFLPSSSRPHQLGKETHKYQKTHSESPQSIPVGHSKAPVTSWLKPRSSFLFRHNGGLSVPPRGVIQSIIAPLRLLVSSDLALLTPFWI